jgi:predicted phage terminase large subunit-like protein
MSTPRTTYQPKDIWTLIKERSASVEALHPPVHFHRWIWYLHRAVNGGHRVYFHAPPQHGKAVADSAPILTDRGWVTVGDVRVGDKLVGSDGRWTTVQAVYPQGDVPLYRVTFNDGASIATCANHLWHVKRRDCAHPRVVSTATLAAGKLLTNPPSTPRASGSGSKCLWWLPVVAPVAYETAELPVDPYCLGAWLGDGHSSAAAITSTDQQIVNAFDAAGYPTRKRTGTSSGKASTYGVGGGFQMQLRALKVLNNKRVPEEYLTSSTEQRLALLHGLTDTDGTCDGNGPSYTTTLPHLAVSFRRLVASLGGVCREYQRTVQTSRPEHARVYTLYFRLPAGIPPFRLERKLAKHLPVTGRSTPKRAIRSIELSGHGHATCFTVDAADHLFCVGDDMVVTHNTSCTLWGLAWILIRRPGKHHAYMTFSAARAGQVNQLFRLIAAASGLTFTGDLKRLTFAGGSTVTFTSGDQGLTGQPITGVLVVDDLYKEQAQADSPAYRHRVETMWANSVVARLHRAASVLVLGTRWHPQDMYGRLIDQGYDQVLLTAIAEEGDPNGRQVGEALFPDRFTVEELADKQREMLPSAWASLYQGRPRARGAGVFSAPTYYSSLPQVYTGAFGIDLAYTSGTKSDFSVCLEMIESNGLYYVVDLWTDRLPIDATAVHLKQRVDAHPEHRVVWRCSSTERASAALLKRPPYDLPIICRTPPGDKLVSATAVAVDWNNGKVALPSPSVYPQHAAWVKQLVDQALDFTGTGKEHDDIIDALGTAHAELRSSNNIGFRGAGSRLT